MKYYLLVCLIIATTVGATSQTQFGVKGGLNFTFFNEDQSQFGEQARVDIGYFGGVFVNIPVSEKLNIQPEVLYNRIGDFDLINGPVYLVYDVNNSISLLVGPSVNYFFNIFNRNFKVRGDVAAVYHITEGFEINLKYTQGFDELSPNIILLGVGFPL